jgi:hypothetical protein
MKLDKDGRFRLTVRITPEQKIAMDVKLAPLQATAQEVMEAMIRGWLESNTPIKVAPQTTVEAPARDTIAPITGDEVYRILTHMEAMDDAIRELARQVGRAGGTQKKGILAPADPKPATVPLYTRSRR